MSSKKTGNSSQCTRKCADWKKDDRFETGIQKVHGDAEKDYLSFFCCEIRAHHSDSNSNYAFNEHQRNAVPHSTIRQLCGLLNFGFQTSCDSSAKMMELKPAANIASHSI